MSAKDSWDLSLLGGGSGLPYGSNIGESGVADRRNVAVYSFLASLAVTVLLKALGRRPKHKFYPVSILWCVGAACWTEAELRTCVVLCALSFYGAGVVDQRVVWNTALVLVVSVGVQLLTYFLLGIGEPGAYFPCCSRRSVGSKKAK